MKINLKGFFSVLVCVFVLFVAISDVNAAQDSGGQNIGVTVDNSLVATPDTPTIVRSENVTTSALGLVVEVGSGYASETLDFFVTVTNTFTGAMETVSYTQGTNASAQTVLVVDNLIPGTVYDFTVRYARSGGVHSADSAPHSVLTSIDAPNLNTIDSITDNSAVLHVAIDPAVIGMTMDFIVEIVGDGTSYTVQMTRDVISGVIELPIDGLDPGVDYTFRVKYAHENTLYFSDYSNTKSIKTDDEALEDPVIVEIKNITTTSMDIVVEVEDQDGEKCDFVVRIINTATGEITKVSVSKTVGSNGQVTLSILGLDPGTEYEFKVKYALDGEDEESDYSNFKRARTAYPSAPQTVICYEARTVTIAESESEYYLARGATVGVCIGTGDEQVTICYKKDTVLVTQSELQSYLDRGAITGECSNIVNDKKVDVCHGGNTITISESALQAHLDHGDTLGACPSELLLGGGIGVDGLRDAMIAEGQKEKYAVASIVGAAAGVTAMLAAMLLPLLAAMPGTLSGSLFLRAIELLGIIGKRKEDQNWGIVFDADTRMPLVAVKIVLSDQFGKELATTYSNRDGRFGFLTDPGTYVIHVFKKEYTLFTDKSNDELYGNVYDGKTITVDSDHVILINLAMKSEITDWQGYSSKKIKQYKTAIFMKYVFFALYIFGFGATIVITILYPSIFNFVVLSIYVVLLGYQLLAEKKKHGSIETNTGDPVPFAVVNLYDQESQEKHNFAVTDATGRYYLLADNGEYKLKAKGQPVSGTQFEKHGEVRVNDGIVRKDIVV